LLPLTAGIEPQAPRREVWERVRQRVHGEAPAPKGWWQRLGLWQGAAAAGFVAAVSSVVVLGTAPPAQPPLVVVLSANPDAAAVMNASFVASLSADGRALVLKPVNVPALEATRAFELWAVPAQGAPRSLGLVSATRGATLVRANLLADTTAFAVSVEPAGGSPSGAPTGPIVSLGKLQL
jgi:anti-sigma-K factor RskA